jgi:hypothetical protein
VPYSFILFLCRWEILPCFPFVKFYCHINKQSTQTITKPHPTTSPTPTWKTTNVGKISCGIHATEKTNSIRIENLNEPGDTITPRPTLPPI